MIAWLIARPRIGLALTLGLAVGCTSPEANEVAQRADAVRIVWTALGQSPESAPRVYWFDGCETWPEISAAWAPTRDAYKFDDVDGCIGFVVGRDGVVNIRGAVLPSQSDLATAEIDWWSMIQWLTPLQPYPDGGAAARVALLQAGL